MNEAYQNESEERGKSMLRSMLDNVEMAEEMELPVCQSPGFPTVYVKFGDKTTPGDIELFWEKHWLMLQMKVISDQV